MRTCLRSARPLLRRGPVRHVGKRGVAQFAGMPPHAHEPAPYTGPSFDEVKALRAKHLNPAIFAFYKEPVMLVEGNMQYMYDEQGKRYLDLFAGIVTVSVGHCHPKVTQAGLDQMKKMWHSTTIYYNNEIAQYAKELADRMPGDLKVCYFVNSGSEANDLAFLLARLHTGNYDMITVRNAYHGMSAQQMGTTGLHTWKYPVPQGEGVKHALNPDTFRGPYKASDPDAAEKYAWDVQNIIEHATPGAVAGWISESIQGVGGTVELPDGYLPRVYESIRKAGGVCIADEVQTGFGRLGSHFWGFESKGVTPDIVTMAKGIGNGIPLAAVVTTPEIAASLSQRVHFNTYGGNPISMAVGRAVLRAIDEDGIQARAADVGGYFKQRLQELQSRHDVIGCVRGQGLMLGMEITKPGTTEPLPVETAHVFEEAKNRGVLIGKGGLYGNVFRVKPPMCLSRADVDFAIDVLDECFTSL